MNHNWIFSLLRNTHTHAHTISHHVDDSSVFQTETAAPDARLSQSRVRLGPDWHCGSCSRSTPGKIVHTACTAAHHTMLTAPTLHRPVDYTQWEDGDQAFAARKPITFKLITHYARTHTRVQADFLPRDYVRWHRERERERERKKERERATEALNADNKMPAGRVRYFSVASSLWVTLRFLRVGTECECDEP